MIYMPNQRLLKKFEKKFEKKREKKNQKMWLKKEKNGGKTKKNENEGQYEHFLFSMTFEFGTDACFCCIVLLKLYYWKFCWSVRHEEERYISLGK